MIAAPPPAAQNAPAIAGAAATPQPAPAPMAAARAKREAAAMDSLGARELRKSLRVEAQAEADPQRELERIARLREAGDAAAADKALEEFRKRHPDFRIPEAMWERVRPR